MAVIYNSIIIDASPEDVWKVLADPARLDQYDPVTKRSELVSKITTGLGAERKCTTSTGWFSDKITEFEPFEKLTFTLTGCNQPMKSLTHAYSLKAIGHQTEVSQVMKYTMKYGLLGSLLDVLIGKRQSDKQIKLFFKGLKAYIENRVSKN